ncbi:MAG TPA: hypothetical protein PKK10_16885 [Woeseiaceae bacterium]|nr:hypothetical protein [Woeseiaceae bacterium]
MPEITVFDVILVTLAIILGITLGWVTQGKRSGQQKLAIGASWQEQIDAQRSENKRLAGQNRGLMEQVSHLQASQKDASNRAKELSTALKEAFTRRDELQRELKENRSDLKSTLAEREQLERDVQELRISDVALRAAIKEKDDKIFQFSRELDSWHSRLPPLIERFRQRNAEANQLQQELAEALQRISSLEVLLGSEQTRVEPVDAASMPGALDASNDTFDSMIALTGSESFAEALNGARRDEEVPQQGNAGDDSADYRARDNLKEIKGVGPAIEKTLHELGIFRFGQIAEMSEYDIDRVARHLKGFRSRIYREDWIGQARHLRDQRSDA